MFNDREGSHDASSARLAIGAILVLLVLNGSVAQRIMGWAPNVGDIIVL
jgi:hypothetical protein